MNNFGVVELQSAKTTSAPGWAYVPDTGAHPSASSLAQPTNRKRARNAPGPGLSIGDLSARQEAKIRKELEALDKDVAGREGAIPLPGGRGQGKHTPNVRKILQSQKTFGNHLDDFLALQAHGDVNLNPSAANNSRRPAAKAKQDEDTTMTDVTLPPILPIPGEPSTSSVPEVNDPLLASRVPDMPRDTELRALLAHPPLSYVEARGEFQDDDWRSRRRIFCDICGYWGRMRCAKCGTRVCALDCLDTHKQECVTRYGI